MSKVYYFPTDSKTLDRNEYVSGYYWDYDGQRYWYRDVRRTVAGWNTLARELGVPCVPVAH